MTLEYERKQIDLNVNKPDNFVFMSPFTQKRCSKAEDTKSLKQSDITKFYLKVKQFSDDK